MNYQEIVDFIEQNPVCTIATATNNQPHLRAFLTNIIDNTLYFTTSLEKNVGKEIMQNQKSELCYLKQDFSKMLRITTTLKIVDDKKIKEHLISTREYLKHFSVDDTNLILFRLSDSKAKFWELKDNLKESELEILEF